MIGEALAIPGKGGRGPEKYQVIPPWNIAAALTSSTARKCWSAPDDGRPLLAFAGGSVRNAGSAMTGHHTIQAASARCAITLIKWAR